MSVSSIGYTTASNLVNSASAGDQGGSRISTSDATDIKQQAASSAKPADKQPSAQDLEDALKNMNDFVSSMNNNSLRFSVDDDTGRTIVKVYDSQTNEVIKQFPSEEMVAISKALDKLQGLFVQQKA